MVNKLVLLAFLIATSGLYLANSPIPPTEQSYRTPIPHAPGDTLTYFISSGEILIVNLPEQYQGFEIERYEIRSAPALSWLVERSFFWRTLGKESGSFDIVFDAISEGQRIDELVLAVNVQ